MIYSPYFTINHNYWSFKPTELGGTALWVYPQFMAHFLVVRFLLGDGMLRRHRLCPTFIQRSGPAPLPLHQWLQPGHAGRGTPNPSLSKNFFSSHKRKWSGGLWSKDWQLSAKLMWSFFAAIPAKWSQVAVWGEVFQLYPSTIVISP